ncbi:MAG: YidB family protein [Xylophilus ampelinus]
MGLLDSVIGSVLKGGTEGIGAGAAPGAAPPGGLGGMLGGLGGLGGLGALAAVLGPMLTAPDGPVGGLPGLARKFSEAGLGPIFASWIGKGENLPVSGGQVQDALGGDLIGSIAAKVGMDAAQLREMAAQWLPQIVDRLTPEGRLPAEGGAPGSGDLLGALGSLLQKK